jgi:hypothetical protein
MGTYEGNKKARGGGDIIQLINLVSFIIIFISFSYFQSESIRIHSKNLEVFPSHKVLVIQNIHYIKLLLFQYIFSKYDLKMHNNMCLFMSIYGREKSYGVTKKRKVFFFKKCYAFSCACKWLGEKRVK